MKNSKSFRLSVQALDALRYLSSETGANETAILEMSLAFYRKAYDAAKLADISSLVGRDVSRSVIEHVSIVDASSKKKRKRSRH